jgi:hypothetical protein
MKKKLSKKKYERAIEESSQRHRKALKDRQMEIVESYYQFLDRKNRVST